MEPREPEFRATHPLVVGVDWTEGSQHALEWTAALGRRLGAPLELIHAGSPWVGLEMAIPPFDYDRYRAAIQREMESWADKVVGVDHQETIVEDYAAEAILRRAESTDAGLIVLGAHGHRAWTPHLLGSVTSAVLHRASRPVAVVPQTAPASATQGRVVVGVDGSASSMRALRWAVSYADELGVEPYAVCVVPIERYAEQPRLAEFDSGDRLADTLTGLRRLTTDVEGETRVPIAADVLMGHPASVLVEIVRPDDVLVVGAMGHGPLAAAVLGSTSRSCATHAETATVVVP